MTGYILFALSVGVIGILIAKLEDKNEMISILKYETDYLFKELHKK